MRRPLPASTTLPIAPGRVRRSMPPKDGAKSAAKPVEARATKIHNGNARRIGRRQAGVQPPRGAAACAIRAAACQRCLRADWSAAPAGIPPAGQPPGRTAPSAWCRSAAASRAITACRRRSAAWRWRSLRERYADFGPTFAAEKILRRKPQAYLRLAHGGRFACNGPDGNHPLGVGTLGRVDGFDEGFDQYYPTREADERAEGGVGFLAT